MASGYQSHSGDASRAGYHGDETWTQRRARSKTDWAGVPIGCAFNSSLDYYLRLEAQRRFYRFCRKTQRGAARSIGVDSSKWKVKPQIGPCYTTYPPTLAAQAAIGLTGFMEFRALAPAQVLVNRLTEYLKEPAKADGVSADPNIYRAVAVQVVKAVQTRLLLHSLSRTAGMAAVETYRLFSAWGQNLRFRTVGEIVETVVVYGDVLPEWGALELHAVTRQLFEEIENASRSHFELLNEAKPHELMNLGEMWVRDLMSTLAPHLPGSEREPKPTQPVSEVGPQPDEGCFQLGKPEVTAEPPENFGPLDGPAPPSLAGVAGPGQPPGSDLARRLAALLASEPQKVPPDPAHGSVGKKILEQFSRTLQEACAQTKRTEDMRSDLVEEALRLGSFEASPLQGNPIDGHEVTIRLGENQMVGAQIYDRPVELSDDVEACDRLLEESGPISRELKRVLYPNVEPVPETTRLCTSGSLDGGRLPLAEFSSTLFKRTRVQKRPDRRGRPVLLLVCDGSGSLNQHQMRMTKLLAAGWLVSTARTGIQVLAALYNQGPISRGIAGALIHWIHHPEKTAVLNRREAIRAVAALGDKGSGGQADAPSLQFLLDEALRLSRGRSIYLVLMSDTKWVRSVGGKNGYEEVRAVLEDHMGRLEDRLHVTLVALGVNGKTGFENVVDAVVRVSDAEITDAAAVAKKIALYVAACMRERRKLLDTRH